MALSAIVQLWLRLDLHSFFRQPNSACFRVWSQTDTATAAGRCTMPRYDLSRQVHTSMSTWALVLLRHNRCCQGLRPAVPRKSSHFLQLTDHESLFRWHAVLRSRFLDSRLSVALCQPRFHGTISDPDCLLARMCTCTSLFLRMATLGLCTLSQKHAQIQFSRIFTWNLVRLHAACRINHAVKMLSLGSFSRRRSSSDNHIARQTPLITRFAFSILPWL